ncbi:TIGR01777 family oxidoreductase [Zeaxanthinibacter sp. PT1]|uniref:TIGR01777 family oxidoreductase n=1 Tax=Zeaxanthinibacter TaxID=561554 RepID=UPI00234B205F|nr:TIGR01777 family oxidoreductase [Zeaxanthinibacter sp. PT1]MDC6352479.1 TIGR01777 family oxidoreductase [Zeaxanthinibacter sp. PT1]
MKILITGATGLVGSHIVRLCRQENIEVHYLTTSKDKIEAKEGYQGFYWDPSKREIDTKCFKGVDGIINLAGTSIAQRWTDEHKKAIMESRVNSLKTLDIGLAKVDRSKIKSVVSASAVGYYPDSLTNYYSESETEHDKSFLGEVVVAWEREADNLKKYDFKLAKVRIGLVLANDGGALPQMVKPVDNYVGAALGSGEQWQSWIHIHDLASIFLYVLKNNLSGVYNAVAPNPVTNGRMTREMARELGKPLWLPNVPKVVMTTILGEMAYILFSSQRASSKKIEEKGYMFEFCNIQNALTDLLNSGDEKVSSQAKLEEQRATR